MTEAAFTPRSLVLITVFISHEARKVSDPCEVLIPVKDIYFFRVVFLGYVDRLAPPPLVIVEGVDTYIDL